MPKKKNNRSNVLNCKGKEIYTLTMLPSPEANKFILEQTLELSESAALVKPTPPLVGNVYCLDFKYSKYKRVLKHLKIIAAILCQNKEIRTFLVKSTCIYIVTPYSYDVLGKEINAAYGYLVLFLYDMDKSQNKIDSDTEIIALYLLEGFRANNLEWCGSPSRNDKKDNS